MISIRFNTSDLNYFITGKNKEFITYIFDDMFSLYSNDICVWFTEHNIDQVLRGLLETYNIKYNIDVGSHQKILLELLNKEKEYSYTKSRFKLYYEHSQESFIMNLIQIKSFIEAMLNKKRVIDETEGNEKNRNNRLHNINKIKSNREAYKKAKNSF